jgi:hypothetical protein
VNEITLEDIQAFLSANPTISRQELVALAAQNGVPEALLNQAISTMPQQQVPPTGLIGREQALQAGLEGALSGVEQGYTQGRQDINQGVQGSEALLREAYGAGAGEIRQGVQGAENLLREAYGAGSGEIRQGGDAAEALLREAYGAGSGELRMGRDAATGALTNAAGQATGDIQRANQSALAEILQGRQDTTQGLQGAMGSLQQGFDRGIAGFQPYQQAGTEALNPLSALSGARGQDAFNQAYVDNPYVNFLREQGERSVLGNASATGGLRGGDVMKELTRFGQGLAGQGIQQQIGNLQFLTGQGMNAAQGIGNLSGQQGTAMAGAQQNAANMLTGQSNLAAQQQANTGANLADIGMTTGANISGLLSGTGQQLSNLAGNLGSSGATVRANQGNQLASLASGLGSTGAQARMSGGQLLSGLASNIGTQGAQNVYGGGLANAQAALGAGNQAGQFAFNTGQNLATGRTSAGDMLAGQVAGTAAGLGNLANQQGAGIAGVYDAQTSNLANILSQSGMSQADIQRIIAQSQAGAAQTGAGQYAGLGAIPGTQQTTGIIGNLVQGGQAAGTLMAMSSDYRLKDNITWQSNHNGVNLYSWDWKTEFSDITAGMPTQGVIAQEVAITHPDAVFMTKSGFLAVDYSKVN